jgi:uncharacterized membrane protein YhaH (DUF805 family)
MPIAEFLKSKEWGRLAYLIATAANVIFLIILIELLDRTDILGLFVLLCGGLQVWFTIKRLRDLGTHWSLIFVWFIPIANFVCLFLLFVLPRGCLRGKSSEANSAAR